MTGSEARMVHGPFSDVEEKSFVIRILRGINSEV